MDIELDEKLLHNIHDLIRYQNNLLIKQIAEDYKWDLKKLKPYIKDKIQETLNTKSKSVKKKEPVKKTDIVKKTYDNIDDKKKSSESESESEVKVIKKKVIIKKKKGKTKDINKDKAYSLISYQNESYYLDNKTQYVYQKILDEEDTGDFAGLLEGNKINFDAEASD